MTNVKLSDKPCALCGVKEDTMSVKNIQESFQAVLCHKHRLVMLKKWEAPPVALSTEQPANRS